MYWLIFFLFFSCGKHQEPSLKDVTDSDGDQILNYQEEGASKYIADLELPPEISGKIRIQAFSDREISFTNKSDLREKALKAATQERTNKDEFFFSEFFDLHLQGGENIQISSDFNTLHLFFDQSELEAQEIILRSPDQEKSLGQWEPHKRISLDQEELKGLLSGKNKLRVKISLPPARYFYESRDETIRKKTYKVFFSDGAISKVLYVSKELTLESLKQALNISESQEVIESELFFNSLEQSPQQWFHRIHPNGDIALVKITLQDLREKFLQGLDKKSFKLNRENGSAGPAFHLSTTPGKTVYLKIRPVKSIRSFQEYSETKTYRTGGGYYGHNSEWTCTLQLRRIHSEKVITPILEDFLNNLSLNISREEDFHVLEQIDDQGVFWEISFTSASDSISLSLNNSPPSSFTITGQYGGRCSEINQNPWVYGQTQTNIEGYLRFEIDGLVEKKRERP